MTTTSVPLSELPPRGTPAETDLLPDLPVGATVLQKLTIGDLEAEIETAVEADLAGLGLRGVAMNCLGAPPTASEVMDAIIFERTTTFPANFAAAGDVVASVGKIITNPTATFLADINVNGATVGTMSVSTAGVFTFATVGGIAVVCNPDDLMEVVAPVTPDATAAGFIWTLAAQTS